jgi:hypothetical protein
LVSALTSSAVDRGLDSWSGQTKDLVSVLTSSNVETMNLTHDLQHSR